MTSFDLSGHAKDVTTINNKVTTQQEEINVQGLWQGNLTKLQSQNFI